MDKAWVAALCMVWPGMAQAGDPLFGADGYRIAHYRGPVADAPEGVRRIAAEAVSRLNGQAILVDVLPAQGAVRDADGAWHLALARPSLPGAHWFPEAGRGVLAPATAAWFQRGLARLTGGDKTRMIVTFCLADCWMSWNAARRLHAWGYTNVWWFAEGTDGWAERGLPLTDVTPEGE